MVAELDVAKVGHSSVSGLGHSDHPSVVFSDGNRVWSIFYAGYSTWSLLYEIAGWRSLWLEWPSAGKIPWLSANLPDFEKAVGKVSQNGIEPELFCCVIIMLSLRLVQLTGWLTVWDPTLKSMDQGPSPRSRPRAGICV